MSQFLTVNGIEYVPAATAGKHFGYTRDYMLTLARDGKIDGQKIGHRWYIHVASAEQYFNEAKIIHEERKHKISNERKAELRSNAHAPTHVRAKNTSRAGVLETIAILGIGLLIGTTGYLGVLPPEDNRALAIEGETSFFKKLAASFFDFISQNDSEVIHTSEKISTNEPVIEHENKPAVIYSGTTTSTSIVIAPNQILTTTTVESIRDSFSDDVSVSIDPEHPDTGIIIPHFKDSDGEAYRYLLVPVTEANGS